ncbi:MAG TPA: (Fe-S)-binding protein [Polyangiaceae bacterium]|nr:(Fe-S)-binding protein [Polyangiaceae bacterium]
MPGHLSLPLLHERQDELSKCAFCPKLCRATCVVSEQEPREVLTPWGKMTSAFAASRTGAVDAQQAALAWACSNCFRCREACDHRNPVAKTLNDARADYVAQGLAPPSVRALLERRDRIEAEQRAAAEALAVAPGVEQGSKTALLVGCRYAQVHPQEARAAIRLAVALAGPVRLVSECCGAWQRSAGAPEAADASRARHQLQLAGVKRLLVADPRCALELTDPSSDSSLTPSPEPLTLIELASRHPDRFGAVRTEKSLRYHDSCALGRGLGMYDEPRALLQRLTGEAPLELETSRELGRCSGAGGLLPVSMPEVSTAAAARLLREHQGLGGGVLVTSCASSLSQLRRGGAEVWDLVSLLAEGLPDHG